MSAKSVLITGGAGFIGLRLAIRLARHADVTIFDNFHPQVHHGQPDPRLRLQQHGIRIIEGDIRDPSAIRKAVADTRPALIYHLAAETGTGQSFTELARYNDVNVMGTAHLIEAVQRYAPHLPRIVLAGSRAVYGEGACVDAKGRPAQPQIRLVDDMAKGRFEPRNSAGAALVPVPSHAGCPVAPVSVYAATKLMQEYLLQQAFWGSGTAVGILRLQNVYGPGQSLNNPYTGVLSIFCRQIQEGQILNIYEDGQITRDFVLVDDVVRALAMMGQVAAMPRDIVDIGSGQGVSILQVAQMLLQLFGEPADRLRITGAFRPGDIRHAVADISRAAACLGWTPQVTLAAGLSSLAAWSRAQMHGAKPFAAVAQAGA